MTAAPAYPSISGPWPEPFGRYRLREHLGSGGMGSVFKAFDTILECIVALKVPSPDLAGNPKIGELFLEEARIGAQLDHNNICKIHDFGWVGETPYLIMAFIEGEPLSRYRPTAQAWWEPWSAATVVQTVADAMATAHARGFLHRDLKPPNIRVRPKPPHDPQVKPWPSPDPVIIDFGLALRLGLSPPGSSPAEASWAIPSGTLEYLSPESLMKKRAVGPYSDVYSLGVIFYELLTGEFPFTRTPTSALIAEITNDSFEPKPSRLSAIPPALWEVCCTAMARKVEGRYPGMRELSDAIDAARNPSVSPHRSVWSQWFGSSFRTRGIVKRSLADGNRPPTLIEPDRVEFAFLADEVFDVTPPSGGDGLFLCVGRGLDVAVIDRRHNLGYEGSTTSLVRNRPDLVQAAVGEGSPSSGPFTITLQRLPDLDSVASAYLAMSLLASGVFPEGDDILARYMDGVVEGSIGMSPSQPFSLYPAFRRLAERSGQDRSDRSKVVRSKLVRQGLKLVQFALGEAVRSGKSLLEVDAFACPGLFDAAERKAIQDDLDRYDRKLGDPATGVRIARLRLPGRFGGEVEIDALVVTDFGDDADRCLYVEDWAKHDAERSRNGRGFEAVAVLSERKGSRPSCTISVTPRRNGSLVGLGDRLNAAEDAARTEARGADARPPDDRWYDGRDDRFRMVKSPPSGSALTAIAIEDLFLDFGKAEGIGTPLA